MLELFISGLAEVINIQILLYMFIGVIAGIIAGSIPGFTIAMAIVITLPFTYGMSPIAGISTMMGVFVGGLSGGLMTSALLGIPGTPSAIATTFDAHPMVKKGEPGNALGIGIWASFFGSIISMVVLIALAPQVARFALQFGPWEYFSLIVFALTIIASVVGKSMISGLLSGLFGLFIATIGADPMMGVSRFTFDLSTLRGGIPFLTVLIGMFALSRLLKDLEVTESDNSVSIQDNKLEDIKFNPLNSAKIVLSQPVNLIRSSLIGTLIGAIPGAGGSIANILAYDQAKKSSKRSSEFGTGISDGVIASEAGNNSTAGGGLIPMIALGIPGCAVTAAMLSALMVHGINPGPMLIQNHSNIVGSIFIAFLIASIFMLILQFIGVKYFMKISAVPKHYLAPIILALCVIGAFTLNNRATDLYILLVMGVVGYIFMKTDFALPPAILGVILGPIAEQNLRRAIMASTDWTLFFTRPISLAFLVLALVSIVFTLWQNHKNKQQNAEG